MAVNESFLGLEQGALEPKATTSESSKNRYLHSIAISEKRQADALERIADEIAGGFGKHSLGEVIAGLANR